MLYWKDICSLTEQTIRLTLLYVYHTELPHNAHLLLQSPDLPACYKLFYALTRQFVDKPTHSCRIVNWPTANFKHHIKNIDYLLQIRHQMFGELTSTQTVQSTS